MIRFTRRRAAEALLVTVLAIQVVSANVAGATTLESANLSGNASGGFSPDSTRLLFRTQATNVVAGVADSNNSPD